MREWSCFTPVAVYIGLICSIPGKKRHDSLSLLIWTLFFKKSKRNFETYKWLAHYLVLQPVHDSLCYEQPHRKVVLLPNNKRAKVCKPVNIVGNVVLLLLLLLLLDSMQTRRWWNSLQAGNVGGLGAEQPGPGPGVGLCRTPNLWRGPGAAAGLWLISTQQLWATALGWSCLSSD